MINSTDPTNLYQDPAYREGMAHYQAGDWPAALASFQQVAQHFPGERALEDLIADAQFKADRDKVTRVRGKRWIISWPRILGALVITTILSLVAVAGVRAMRDWIAPAWAEARQIRDTSALLKEAHAYLAAGHLDDAEAKYWAYLGRVPDNAEAQKGLDQILVQRELLAMYEQGVALQETGDRDGALTAFTDLLMRAPQYRDVRLRVGDLRRSQDIEGLYAGAEADLAAGLYADALEKYAQLQLLDSNYQVSAVQDRLFELYMLLGREAISYNPPRAELVPQAEDYFARALSLRPRDTDAALEQRLTQLFSQGYTLYQQGYWGEAITKLRAVYDRRPGYMSGLVLAALYDAYIRNGDEFFKSNDIGFAYELYRQASALPVADATLARNRLDVVTPLMTPTATPTVTPTPTNTPLPTETPRPTPVPTARPLTAYRNAIAFLSDNEDHPGVWVMDANFKNRTYLGDTRALRALLTQLYEGHAYSPDGRYRLYVDKADDSDQIFVGRPADPTGAPQQPVQLTRLLVCYDPVWSPDGGRIAFVSEQDRTDDIWVMNPDGSDVRNLTENGWEWEKHPTWSPDGTKIVFWSNREGRQQLYIMDADGRNVRNISNSPDNEWDPVWIR